jgi:hypothetical protein
MLPKDHDGVIITGKRKKGKTTLSTQFLWDEPRVIMYDAKAELTQPIQIYCGGYPKLSTKGIYRAYVVNGNSPADELEWAAYVAIQLGRCLFYVDELSDALEDGEPGPHFKWVTRMGRKRDIRFMYSFQRPQEVPRMVTAQAADWYLHQTNEPNELEYIRASVSKEAADLVRNLKRGQSVHVKDGNVVGIMESYNPERIKIIELTK